MGPCSGCFHRSPPTRRGSERRSPRVSDGMSRIRDPGLFVHFLRNAFVCNISTKNFVPDPEREPCARRERCTSQTSVTSFISGSFFGASGQRAATRHDHLLSVFFGPEHSFVVRVGAGVLVVLWLRIEQDPAQQSSHHLPPHLKHQTELFFFATQPSMFFPL